MSHDRTTKISKVETLRRDEARRAKFAKAFDCESANVSDYNDDDTRDYDETIAALELRDSLSACAARDFDYNDAIELI